MGTCVGVAVSVNVGSGETVSEGAELAIGVGEKEMGVGVLVVGWQATSIMVMNRTALFNMRTPFHTLRIYLKPSKKSVSICLPPFTRLKTR